MNFESIRSNKLLVKQKFDCGQEELNTFLKSYAYKNDLHGIGKTYLAKENDIICGFITICSCSVEFKEITSKIKEKLPKYPIPAIKIARLAVDKKYQNKGIGKYLLKNALQKIVQAAEIVGVYLVLVDAKENATGFYEKFGFQKLKDNSLTYFLPIQTIQSAIKKNDPR